MSARQRKLSVLTFNVHGERDATTQQISQFINDANADVVCLQEHVSTIELQLPDYVLMSIGYGESVEANKPGHLSNAIFVKRKLLKEQKKDVARSNMVFQPECEKSVPRSASVIYIEGVTIANIHQTGGCGDDFLYKDLKTTKGNQIKRLVRAFQPDIIVGDLNAESSEADAREQMKTYRFYQTLNTAQRDEFLDYYLCGHAMLKHLGYEAIYETEQVRPTSVFGGVPDWIYVRMASYDRLIRVEFEKRKAIPLLSDHNAILAIFTITN